MLNSKIIAAYRQPSTDDAARGPIAGIALALPVSLVLWAMFLGVARLVL